MSRVTTSPRRRRKLRWMRSAIAFLALAVVVAAGCGMADEDPYRSVDLDDGVEVRVQELGSFCSVQVEGYGTLDVEEDYLPSVVACENGNAPMEALKAQAVAARTFAYFIQEAEQRPLIPTTDDQVYGCDYAQVEDRHIQAVQETAGQVLVHNDQLLASFYVAGAEPSANSCVAGAGDSDPTNTEQYVTYNQGRTGNDVRPTPLGSAAHPGNRGAKSQNGASCLADPGGPGWDYERILRFYYGDDVRAKISEESQCAGPAPDGGTDPPVDNPGGEGDVCAIPSAGASGGGSTDCFDADQQPEILPRSAWNAATPTSNRPHHTPDRITVHHTVTPNEAADGAAQVKNIQNYHMGLGWADIGYHFLIAWDGTIYRGNPEDRRGAHAGNANQGNLGIAVLGSFHQSVSPSDAQMQSLTRMLRYLSDKHSIALDRSNIKGHQEWSGQSTACPGGNLLNELDSTVQAAAGDAVCGDTASGGDDESAPDVDGYQYVRVTGVDTAPIADGADDVVDGFEVDSIRADRGDDTIQSTDVLCAAGVSNPGGALGEPDNDRCDNRQDRVAGVSQGSNLVVSLSDPIEQGDILHVTQHAYNPAVEPCEPTGTARISVSEDGRNWKVLSNEVTGNWSRTLTEEDFAFDDNDEVWGGEQGFEFIEPVAGDVYTPDLTFKAQVSDPDIHEIEYFIPADAEEVIDEDWTIPDPVTAADGWTVDYEFQYHGERRVAARALDANGNEIGVQEIVITVTDHDGNIPDREDSPSGEANIDTALAALIAEEAGKCYDPQDTHSPRCSGGTGGFSTGHCWRFVKRALDRAGVNWNHLQTAGPCTPYRFQLSAYGFRCNADPNPDELAAIGLQKIDVPTTEAPEGAIIAWDRGCAGFNGDHGHIEISQGDGTACSDYCGNITTDASCASVYVPVQ